MEIPHQCAHWFGMTMLFDALASLCKFQFVSLLNKTKQQSVIRIKGEYNMALYSEKVMDHFQHPRNVGVIEDADGVGEVGNAKCGDIMKIYLKIENDIIEDVKFETFGCGSAIASSSMATEMIKGKSIHEAMELTNKAVAEALDGLPAHKLHCSVLAEEAIKNALKDYYDRRGLPYDEKDFPEFEHEE